MFRRECDESELVEYIKDLEGPRPSHHEIKWYVIENKNISDKRKQEIIHERFSEWCSENVIRWC